MKKIYKQKLIESIFSRLFFRFKCLANSPILNFGSDHIYNFNYLKFTGEKLDGLNIINLSDPNDFIIRSKVNFDNHPDGYYAITANNASLNN